MSDFAQKLIERRTALAVEARTILETRADENGVLPAEDEEQYQKINDQISQLGERVNELVQIAKANKNVEEYREEYESLISPTERAAAKKQQDNALKAFIRGDSDKLVLSGWSKMTRHVDAQGRVDIRAALGEDASAAGGATVPTDFLNTLYQHLIHNSAIRQTNARILPTSNGRPMTLPRANTFGTAVWVGEGTAITGSDPTFNSLTLNAYKIAQIVLMSNELLEDTGVDMSGFIAEDLGRAIGEGEGARFVSGSGTNTPRGVVVGVKADVGTAVQVASATVEWDNMIDLFYHVSPPYRANGFFFMSDDLAAKLRKKKNANGDYVWQPSVVAGQPDQILGRPVVIDPNMEAVGSAKVPVMFGDFNRGFIIREDGDPEITVSADRYFELDSQGWRVTHRVDSDILDSRALDILDTD